MNEVFDAKLDERQHDCLHPRPQDLGVCLLLQLLAETALRVQAEALSWLCTPRSPCPLLRTGLRDGRDQQRLDAHAGIEHLDKEGKLKDVSCIVRHSEDKLLNIMIK